MYTKRKVTSALHSSQVAYPVGKLKDAYTILSRYTENLQTGEIKSIHELMKNDSYSPWKEGMDASSKHRELLHQGTYNECAAIVDNIILKEGEWRQIPSKPLEKELVFTLNK